MPVAAPVTTMVRLVSRSCGVMAFGEVRLPGAVSVVGQRTKNSTNLAGVWHALRMPEHRHHPGCEPPYWQVDSGAGWRKLGQIENWRKLGSESNFHNQALQ